MRFWNVFKSKKKKSDQVNLNLDPVNINPDPQIENKENLRI